MVGPDFVQFLARHAQRRPVPEGGGQRHCTEGRRGRSRAWLVAAATMAVLLNLGGVAAWYVGNRADPNAGQPAPTGPTVAVAKGTPVLTLGCPARDLQPWGAAARRP
jgi:hypothetical protein